MGHGFNVAVVWTLLALDLVLLACMRSRRQRFAWLLANVIFLATLAAMAAIA